MNRFIFSLSTILLITSCGLNPDPGEVIADPFSNQTRTKVIVENKYDVIVVKQPNELEDVYIVAFNSAYEQVPVPRTERRAIYSRAIEQFSGCKVVDDSITFAGGTLLLDDSRMIAGVRC